MKKINDQPKQVRFFLILLFLFIEAFIYKVTGQNPPQSRIILLALPVIPIAVLLIIPKLFFPLFKAILIGSSFLGHFIFVLIAAIVFIFILTPMALAMKLFGKNFMNPDPDPGSCTYYTEPEINRDIKKQF